jgi:hypothetical protein
MIAIAEPRTYIAIDREELAERITHVESHVCPTLQQHGVANKEINEPASMVVSTLYGIAARLKAGLETGASDQDMQADFLSLSLYEDAAQHWASRTTRWDYEIASA